MWPRDDTDTHTCKVPTTITSVHYKECVWYASCLGAVWLFGWALSGKQLDRFRASREVEFVLDVARWCKTTIRCSSAIPRATKEYVLKAALCRLSGFRWAHKLCSVEWLQMMFSCSVASDVKSRQLSVGAFLRINTVVSLLGDVITGNPWVVQAEMEGCM